MNFFKRHWKGIASGVCGVAAVVPVLIPGAAPIGIGVAAVCTLLTAAHVLDAKDVEHAKDLGQGVAGVVAELEQLAAKGKGKAK